MAEVQLLGWAKKGGGFKDFFEINLSLLARNDPIELTNVFSKKGGAKTDHPLRGVRKSWMLHNFVAWEVPCLERRFSGLDGVSRRESCRSVGRPRPSPICWETP